MGDSESFTSLMDLVNSHLSKTSLDASEPGDGATAAFPLSSVRVQTGLTQTVFTPPNGIMSIPRLGNQDNEINNILAKQVSNMLIAKEKKKQEEEEFKRKLEEEKMLKQQNKAVDDYVIDLTSSIIAKKPDQIKAKPLAKKKPTVTFDLEPYICEDDINIEKPRTPLPLNRDMSYMLFRKVKRGRPSAFGKVMSARLRPVAAPYLKLEINNPAVHRFDFSTKSPCDINMEKRLRPPQDPYSHMNMVERFMAQTNNEGAHNSANDYS